jgi:hypothetical protein
LLIPPDREPGTVFAYSQPCTWHRRQTAGRSASSSPPTR